MTYGGVTYKATCTVTVTIPTYSQYGFSEVPDFTAAVGSNIEPEYEDSVYGDETELRYDYYDINWDGEYSLSLDIYRNYLAAKGFEYERTYTDDNGYYSYSVEVYQNDAAGIFVELVLWENDDVSICIYKYKITLNKTRINIQPGFQTTISAETNISSGTIWWVSSNSRVASVEIEDNIVNIVAQKDGIAIITAYFERGGKRYSASCQVTVKTPTYVDYGYAEVPDFAGAVGNNIEPGEIYERTDETEFLYRYSDINWDGRYDDAIELYYDYLSVKGFAYVTTTTGTRDEWTYQAEYYQNTVARIRMIFVRWSDGDISIVMWRY